MIPPADRNRRGFDFLATYPAFASEEGEEMTEADLTLIYSFDHTQ
jgi:hypothetical protein